VTTGTEVAAAERVDDVPGVCRGWISPEPAYMRRASHAVLADGAVWLVDPVDDPGMVEWARTLGPVAGVVQLLDRHDRDCAAIAGRLGVPHHRLPDAPPDGAPFRVIPVAQARRWVERALWFPGHRTLVVADALGTVGYFRAAGEPIGVHPVLRLLRPPRVLAGLGAEHVLCGHGPGLHGPEAGEAVDRAIRRARRGIPSWTWRLIRRRP
jgi:hypothetical protein